MLVCPVCQKPLVQEHNRLLCAKGHSFDLAKEGYVNLLRSGKNGDLIGDDKASARSRRDYIANRHGLAESACFDHWRKLLDLGKIADVAVVSTMDRDHFSPALAAIELGYDILLEKPVSPDPRECEILARAAEKAGVKVIVCHVLRYTPFFTTIKDLVEKGVLGDIISINHEECVGHIHQSHSFVRGNWGNTGRSSCMLLQKSCHDLDILQWIVDKDCKKIQSFGSLRYFTAANAPEGAPERCIDGCPAGQTCPYNAVKLYLDDKKNDWFRDACTDVVSPTDEEVAHALRTSQYGKCVYRCDNDVVDHQTVNMLFEEDVTVTFTMCAFNKGGRYIHIMGTKGELHGAMNSENAPLRLFLYEHGTSFLPVTGKDGIANGHGGGDRGIIESLYEYLTGQYQGRSVSDIRTSVNNHLLVFAAEQSRRTGAVVDLEEYRRNLLAEADPE